MIEVAAGGRLPADGQLLSLFASFDESALTGESVPVERQAGERVAAGATSSTAWCSYRDIGTGRQCHRPHPEAIEEAEDVGRRSSASSTASAGSTPRHYGGRPCWSPLSRRAVLRQRLAAVDFIKRLTLLLIGVRAR